MCALNASGASTDVDSRAYTYRDVDMAYIGAYTQLKYCNIILHHTAGQPSAFRYQRAIFIEDNARYTNNVYK